MKKSINAWSIEDGLNFEQSFKKMKEYGFDGIELNVDGNNDSGHSLTMSTTDEELIEIKALSEKYDLPVVSISSSLGKLGSPKEGDFDFSKELIKKQIQCAKMLGATGVLVVPGGISENQSIKKAYELSFKTLESLKEHIMSQGIIVGLENVWNTFFLSPFDMANFIDKLDCPLIKAYYDVGNVVAFGWTEYFIDILRERIAFVHVKDFKRNRGVNSGGQFVQILQGSIDWNKAMAMLKDIGFDKYITSEVFIAEGQSYDEFYRELSDAQSELIKIYNNI